VQTEKEHRKLGREKLQRIIEMCIAIENHAVDPFTLEINDIIKIVQEFFPQWEKPEDFNLDSEAIHHLAKVIKLQSEWLKHRSTSLYMDPFLLEEKIVQFGKEDIIRIFLKSWHPVVELERLSLQSLLEALRYWNTLLPLEERWRELDVPQVETGTATRDEMIKQRILGDKYFTEELETFWQVLKDKVKEKGFDGKIPYWDFIGAETYEETVQRAFMASFLITYGYATLEIRPLEEKMFIKPFEEVLSTLGNKQLVSIPIAVTYEDWKKWKRGELE
jgi:hypothetical protein